MGTDSSQYDLSYLSTSFLVVHVLGGMVGLPLLVGTIWLSKSVFRHPTLVNLLLTFIIYSVSYCLVLFTGKSALTLDGTVICHVQSAMVHGAPTMCASAGLALIIQIHSTLNNPRQFFPGLRRPFPAHVIPAILYPYVVFVAFTLASAIVQVNHPDKVSGLNGLYCTVYFAPFLRFGVPLYCSLVMFLIVCFNVIVLIQSYRMRLHVSQAFPLAERRPSFESISMVVRVTIFSLYTVFCLSASVTFLSGGYSAWPFMVQATLPLAAFFVFGSQKDLFMVWSFWKSHTTTEFSTMDLPAPTVIVPRHDEVSISEDQEHVDVPLELLPAASPTSSSINMVDYAISHKPSCSK